MIELSSKIVLLAFAQNVISCPNIIKNMMLIIVLIARYGLRVFVKTLIVRFVKIDPKPHQIRNRL